MIPPKVVINQLHKICAKFFCAKLLELKTSTEFPRTTCVIQKRKNILVLDHFTSWIKPFVPSYSGNLESQLSLYGVNLFGINIARSCIAL